MNEPVVAVGLALVGIVGLHVAVRFGWRAWRLSRAEKTRIAAARPGWVRLAGKALPIKGAPRPTSTLGFDCLWYRHDVSRVPGNRSAGLAV